MTIPPGTSLGRYIVRSLIGSGGMGEVYLAHDLQLERPVALKLLPAEFTRDEKRLHRFVQEAKTASALNHPNIVTVYEIGESDESRFIAMELIEGQTLDNIPRADLTQDALLSMISQIAKALAVAHAAGIVHRDIKPQNIMVRADGYIKVLDFGLARLDPTGRIDPDGETIMMESPGLQTTEAGVVLGTFRFMSPEQARGERVSPASDIFSLGIMFYELVTGQHPFPGESPIGTMTAILTQSVIAPRRIKPEIPTSLEALILRMLEKDSRLRPTAAEVAHALRFSTDKLHSENTPPFTAVQRHTVGHEKERAELRKSFGSVVEGRGLMLCVAGEPGIGKSTLVDDFLKELIFNNQSCFIARGRCSERLAGTEAYLPFLDALESLVHSDAGESIARTMKVTAPTWYVQTVTSASERSAERLQSDANPASQEWMKRELATFLQEVSRNRPLVLFLDDLHWSDVSTVELLSYLAGKFEEMRILIIATYRPSELLLAKHPFLQIKLDLQARNISREIALEFLNQDDVQRYLALEYPEHRFPDELAALIYGKTEGSPLFMADMVHYLRDQKVISQHQGRWILAKSVPDIQKELPESVRSMIQRKIEQLTEEDRRLLMAASVQGYEFDSDTVANVLEINAEEVEERLDALERVHAFVVLVEGSEFPDLTPTLRYRFVHVLYQNALYDSARPTRKALLSAAVANSLLAHYRDQGNQIASEVAFLFKVARDFEQAAKYFLLAAENAARVYASQEAIRFYESAGEMISQLSRGAKKPAEELAALKIQMHEELADILKTIGKYDEARESYANAISDLPSHETLRRSRLHRLIGKCWQAQRQSEKALKAFALAEDSLGQEPDGPANEWKQEWIQIQLERVWVYYWLGSLTELTELTTKIAPILDDYGSQTQRGLLFHSLMLYNLRRDRFVTSDETIRLSQAALSAIEGSGDLAEVTSFRFAAGFVQLWRGDLDAAESHFKFALNLASRRDDSINQVLCLTYLAIVARKRGQVEAALSYISPALETATEGEMTTYVAMAKANLAWVAWRRGIRHEVKEYGDSSLELWRQGQNIYPFQWAALWPLIDVALTENRILDAVAYARILIKPTQQQLPDELVSAIEHAVQAGNENQLEECREDLTATVQRAQVFGYL